jgi:excisionase family DNA binding protein
MTTFTSEELQSLIIDAIKLANSKIEISNKEELNIDEKMNQTEAAKFLGVSLPTIIRWKKQKKIPYYQTGRVVIFKKSELLNAMQKNKSLIK